ncbi:MAG TPA: aminotransferase class I/II-fold pyridoxal phosphate-dependent enzyme [Deltaproteobacteria bacterium]|nr:aminotransferase class I/II-fold pyridoxal phosphate-dependent enzyme [Deltaproteobacteria bacterium]
MRAQRDRLALLERMLQDGIDLGIGHCNAQDDRNDGRHVRVGGRDLLNFASCSYLGLEVDSRLIEGAVEAVRAHGIQMCASRAFLSSPLYVEFEGLVEEIFEAHVVVAPTTTLGHLAALPSLIDRDDAIVMDHQVHTSVQMACSFVRASGAHLEVVPHNDLERLEERVADLSARHRQVWYMADGVYSMFGDLAPNHAILEMLQRHSQMRYYVDDAHGMSWCGPRGVGSVLNEIPLHSQMVLTTGLGKGFGTGGGLIILPTAEQKRRIRTCGPTLLFSGPLQPAILGAAIESAKIHLSDEIVELQSDLRERMDLCNALLADLGLPVISSPDTPVGFVGMGPTKACQGLCARLLEEGFFTNPAQFPATPVRRSGGRFLLTRHHRREDIEGLVEAIGRHWEPAILDAGTTPEKVCKAFGMEPPVARRAPARMPSRELGLYLESTDSIEKLDRREWDRLLGARGCIGSRAVSLFEKVFGRAAEPENRWTFRYYIVRDENGDPVLATFFTRSLWKADMLASAEVSKKIEARRAEDPYYLAQWVFGMGCLLSEGDQLWLRDPVASETTRAALRLLLEAVRADADTLDCSVKILRDIPESSEELAAFFEEDGLFRMDSPESLVLDDIYANDEELLARLRWKHRRHQLRDVQPFNDAYRVEIVGLHGRPLAEGEADRLYALYENVKSHSLDLNTFPLPRTLLPALARSAGWEILVVHDAEEPEGPPVGFGACHWHEDAYVPLFMGLDYRYVREKGLYRQQLRHAVIRARELGCRRVLFGFEASLEKRRFGARPEASWMFVEADDHFAFDALAQFESNSA